MSNEEEPKPFDKLAEEAEQIDPLGGKLVAGPGQIVSLTGDSGYPFKDNDGMTVLGPDTLLGPDDEVIVYKGRYYHGQPEPEEPSKPTMTTASAVAEEKKWRRRANRETSMHMAVQVHAASASATSDQLMRTAQTILDWMTQDD